MNYDQIRGLLVLANVLPRNGNRTQLVMTNHMLLLYKMEILLCNIEYYCKSIKTGDKCGLLSKTQCIKGLFFNVHFLTNSFLFFIK